MIVNVSISRRSFLRFLGLGLAFLLFQSKSSRKALAKTGNKLKPRKKRETKTDYDLVVAKGRNASKITKKAIEALGGMKKFVHKGDTVVIKPNIAWDRKPKQGANTNPKIVKVLVQMCFKAGAKKVKVFDNPCNECVLTYKNSGIARAVKKTKGSIYYVNSWQFIPGEFPEGSLMDEWPIYQDAVECDCFINVPIAKHHGLTKLTLSMKNLMGICGGRRGKIHQQIDKKLVELTEFIKPDLTVIDATRILLRNGPTGGDLKDVKKKNTVIVGADPVLADAYATTLFGLKPEDIGYIKLGAEAGLGNIEIDKANIKKV